MKKENKKQGLTELKYIVIVIIITTYGYINALDHREIKEDLEINQHYLEQHHKHYHELIKENHQLNDWYQNHDCDVSYEPCSVSINCDKYEL